jgi:hypothetical protein
MHRRTCLINYEPLIVAPSNRPEFGTLTPL